MKRFRPGRETPVIRDARAETHVTVKHWILPLFVVEGSGVRREIPGLAGTHHVSVDRIAAYVKPFMDRGVDKVLIFGVPAESRKTAGGDFAWSPESPVVGAIKALKQVFPALIVMTDICLCAYTNHGHCGILHGQIIDNDATIPRLADMAVAHAQAGADFVAPSAMMDGQVEAIAAGLTAAGWRAKTKILSYSAKFASGLYGPFRGAAGSKPGFGDRKSYQMDYRNGREALEEIAADLDEGADWVMVKPGLTYLDVIARAKDRFPKITMTAYHTSGEYMMLQAAAAQRVCDYRATLTEQMHALLRAGTDAIISYAVRDWLEIDSNE